MIIIAMLLAPSATTNTVLATALLSHHRMADDSRRWDAEKREEVRRQAEMAKAARESTGTKHDHTQFTRNAEGEAQAQFRDEDFDFGVSPPVALASLPACSWHRTPVAHCSGRAWSCVPVFLRARTREDGLHHGTSWRRIPRRVSQMMRFTGQGKSKQMLGSDGTIIDLEDGGPKEPAKVFKARDAGTVQRQGRSFFDLISKEYTLYKFTLSFGKQKWEIGKRFSDFDKLDNRLNDKFGLPPVGLPAKKWFGLDDAELIMERHKVLIAYLNDCLKRPVLLHSRELQNFCEMPEDAVHVITKGT